MRHRLSARAQADFDQIIEFLLNEAGSTVAMRYGRNMQSCINRLAQFPFSGSPRPTLGSGIRVAWVAPYLIFYEVEAESEVVRVLRILHERRNITQGLIRGR